MLKQLFQSEKWWDIKKCIRKNKQEIWSHLSDIHCVCAQSLSVQLFATPWTVACQTPLSIEYWSGLPFAPPRDLPNPGIKPHFLHCRWMLYHWTTGEAPDIYYINIHMYTYTHRYINVCTHTHVYIYQFSHSVVSDSLWPVDWCVPGLPVQHQLPELAQTHVHRVGDAIQPSHPLLPPSPPAFILSQHQGLSQRVSSLHQVAKVLELQLQHQSFQWIFRVDFL